MQSQLHNQARSLVIPGLRQDMPLMEIQRTAHKCETKSSAIRWDAFLQTWPMRGIKQSAYELDRQPRTCIRNDHVNPIRDSLGFYPHKSKTGGVLDCIKKEVLKHARQKRGITLHVQRSGRHPVVQFDLFQISVHFETIHDHFEYFIQPDQCESAFRTIKVQMRNYPGAKILRRSQFTAKCGGNLKQTFPVDVFTEGQGFQNGDDLANMLERYFEVVSQVSEPVMCRGRKKRSIVHGRSILSSGDASIVRIVAASFHLLLGILLSIAEKWPVSTRCYDRPVDYGGFPFKEAFYFRAILIRETLESVIKGIVPGCELKRVPKCELERSMKVSSVAAVC